MIVNSIGAAETGSDTFEERLRIGLDYLRTFDPATPVGKVEIDGERVKAAIQEYETAPAVEGKFESHRRHVDIQYIVSGTERILHAWTDDLVPAGEYNDQKDVQFYQDATVTTSVLLNAGDYTVFHPRDGHKPGCMAGGKERVKKVVVKIRLD